MCVASIVKWSWFDPVFFLQIHLVDVPSQSKMCISKDKWQIIPELEIFFSEILTKWLYLCQSPSLLISGSRSWPRLSQKTWKIYREKIREKIWARLVESLTMFKSVWLTLNQGSKEVLVWSQQLLCGCPNEKSLRYNETPLNCFYTYRKIPKISPSKYKPLKLVTEKTCR